MFERPLLIYDDKCSSCAKFARVSSILSRGWLKTAGHYYSADAKKAKHLVFPPDYDPTKMFWLINRNGAYGARAGLLPLGTEILRGLLRGGKNIDSITIVCEYNETMTCYTKVNTAKRLVNMLRNSAYFPFK